MTLRGVGQNARPKGMRNFGDNWMGCYNGDTAEPPYARKRLKHILQHCHGEGATKFRRHHARQPLLSANRTLSGHDRPHAALAHAAQSVIRSRNFI
jgi:hypothetical protein